MKNKYIFISVFIAVAGLFVSCDEDSWLERTPKDRITDEQLWNDANMITGLLANYYDRIYNKITEPKMEGVFNTGMSCLYDDAMWSGHVDQNWRNDYAYPDDYARYWDYTFIRDINLALENMEEYSVKITDVQ